MECIVENRIDYKTQNPSTIIQEKISFWNLSFVICHLPPSGGFFVSFKHYVRLLRVKLRFTDILFGRDLPALKRANPL